MEPTDGDPPPPPPPFWPQPPTVHHNSRRLSPLLNPALLIVLVPIAILLLVFFLPPFLSSSQILKPTTSITVKKSWDFVTILLVLVAILGGVFARKDDNDDRGSSSMSISTTTATTNQQCVRNLNLNPPQQWFDPYQFQKIVATAPPRIELRGSNSYPDLKQDSVWGATGSGGDDGFRFFDDFDLDNYRNFNVDDDSVSHRHELVGEESEIEVIPADDFQSVSPPPPSTPSERPTVRRTAHRSVRKEKSEVKRPKTPPPTRSPVSEVSSSPPPPPPPFPPPSESERSDVRRSTRTTYRSVPRKEKSEVERPISPPTAAAAAAPPSPPPPPPPSEENVAARSDELEVRIERKKSNATKELKSVLASIYNQRKRKKTQKTKIIIDDSLQSATPSTDLGFRQPQPPPPPPPLPPPPSVFNNLFKKSSKSKIVHPTPPPPPPIFRSSKFQTKIIPPSKPTSEISARRSSMNSGRPPLPSRTNNFHDRDEISNSGGQPPLIPVTPPPPFLKTEMKFAVRGGCAREDGDLSGKNGKDGMDGGDLIGSSSSVCCPSPDVNMKADDFIARLHGEWKLAKNNSLKEKQALGQGPGPC